MSKKAKKGGRVTTRVLPWPDWLPRKRWYDAALVPTRTQVQVELDRMEDDLRAEGRLTMATGQE